MTSKYKKIKMILKEKEISLKQYKYGRPHKRLSDEWLSYRRELNVVRFLNTYLFYVKHSGERSVSEIKKDVCFYTKSEYSTFCFLPGIIKIYPSDDKRADEVFYRQECRMTVGTKTYLLPEILDIVNIYSDINDISGSLKDRCEIFIEETKDYRDWLKKANPFM